LVAIHDDFNKVRPLRCPECSIEDLFLPNLSGTAWSKPQIRVSMNYLKGRLHGKVFAEYTDGKKEYFYNEGFLISESIIED